MYKELTKANEKKQLARISQQLWTKSDIGAFAKLLNSCRRSSKERQTQIMELWNKLETRANNKTYSITLEQSQFGIEYLNKLCFTSKGKNRNSKQVQDFMESDFDIVRNFHHFEFVGFHELSNMYSSHYAPIYRTVAKDGTYFDYVCRMWQAPEIVGRGTMKLVTKLEKALA